MKPGPKMTPGLGGVGRVRDLGGEGRRSGVLEVTPREPSRTRAGYRRRAGFGARAKMSG